MGYWESNRSTMFEGYRDCVSWQMSPDSTNINEIMGYKMDIPRVATKPAWEVPQKLMFRDGRGTGKSFLLDLMLRYLREKHPPKGYVANVPEVPVQGDRAGLDKSKDPIGKLLGIGFLSREFF